MKVVAMFLIKKLFGLWMVGQSVSTTTKLFTRLLISMAAIAIFITFACLLLLLVFGSGVWIAYIQLTNHGYEPQAALLILSGLALALLAVTVLLVQHHLSRMREISQTLMHSRSPVTHKFSQVVDAFMEGLHSKGSMR